MGITAYRYKGQHFVMQPFDFTTITYNSSTNDVLNEPSLLTLHNFVICGHISYQQEPSQRAILDHSDYLCYV